MESRIRTVEIEEFRIYILGLNTFGAAEDGEVVAVSDDLKKLQDFYLAELLPLDQRFRDEAKFLHSFREGPLYNYNPCASIELNQLSTFGFGIHDEWVTKSEIPVIKSNYRWI